MCTPRSPAPQWHSRALGNACGFQYYSSGISFPHPSDENTSSGFVFPKGWVDYSNSLDWKPRAKQALAKSDSCRFLFFCPPRLDNVTNYFKQNTGSEPDTSFFFVLLKCNKPLNYIQLSVWCNKSFLMLHLPVKHKLHFLNQQFFNTTQGAWKRPATACQEENKTKPVREWGQPFNRGTAGPQYRKSSVFHPLNTTRKAHMSSCCMVSGFHFQIAQY